MLFYITFAVLGILCSYWSLGFIEDYRMRRALARLPNVERISLEEFEAHVEVENMIRDWNGE